MQYTELAKHTADLLVQQMRQKMKQLIHDLVRKGASIGGVRECLVWHTRQIAKRENTITELMIEEYCARMQRGEIKLEDVP